MIHHKSKTQQLILWLFTSEPPASLPTVSFVDFLERSPDSSYWALTSYPVPVQNFFLPNQPLTELLYYKQVQFTLILPHVLPLGLSLSKHSRDTPQWWTCSNYAQCHCLWQHTYKTKILCKTRNPTNDISCDSLLSPCVQLSCPSLTATEGHTNTINIINMVCVPQSWQIFNLSFC